MKTNTIDSHPGKIIDKLCFQITFNSSFDTHFLMVPFKNIRIETNNHSILEFFSEIQFLLL